MLHDVALQIAAAPRGPGVREAGPGQGRPPEHEKEILVAQARNEGKPENIIEKMVTGRINKFYQEVCLLEQPFVKDGDVSVAKMLEQKAKGLEDPALYPLQDGEGLEKKVSDHAEVAGAGRHEEVIYNGRERAAFPFLPKYRRRYHVDLQTDHPQALRRDPAPGAAHATTRTGWLRQPTCWRDSGTWGYRPGWCWGR